METNTLGRFGHHPDPAIDFCVEVECIEGMAYDARVGLQEVGPVSGRIERAMTFRVGGDAGAVYAKGLLRKAETEVQALKDTPHV